MTTSVSGPLTEARLDALADAIAADAAVAGLGESTRAAHETFVVRDQLFRRLVRRHGFRALALQDDAVAGERLDAYVNGGEGTAVSALHGAWRPWRTAETAEALRWIRAFNRDHRDDPVRVFGVKLAQAGPADYDAVLAGVRAAAPHRLAELARHLEPIRTAHETDEHVQQARGLHPGRPFADHARDALAVVERLPDTSLLAPMRRIVRFHERSVAGRDDYAGDARTWGEAITGHHVSTGRRVAYWDGIAHTAATPVTLGLAAERGARPTVGSVLRHRHGGAYVSVAIGFHHGDLGGVVVPPPEPDWIDARLAVPDSPATWVDLRDDVQRRRWRGPATARVISGVYTAARDAAEHLTVASLPDAFDVLVHIGRVSPLHNPT
ncbi:erythromycin esterase family protein [Streptomyces sp. NPDC050085]|uniref:erythromycin esterase family protein n=1 Tax=Streptomyces sp. NPDC050085 TaxID=3365600 RepID=UPI0037BC693C